MRLLTTCFAVLVISAGLTSAQESPRLFSLPAKSFSAPAKATPTERYQLQYREVVEYLLRFYNNHERIASLLKQSPPAMATEAERDEAIHKLIASLDDRWTVYRSPSELADANRRDASGDIAYGIVLDEVKDGYVVAYVSGASPAYRAGIKRGDRIVAIDGLPISYLHHDVVKSLLYGQPGHVTVTLRVQEHEVEVPLHLAASGARIVTSSIVEGAWYFHVQSFSSDKILTEFAEEAEKLNKANGSPRGIILDLRGNHGGYMEFAYQFVSILVQEGKIGETVTRSGRVQSRTILEAQPIAPTLLRQTAANKRLVKILQTAPLVVLTDGSTISAGEMVASALKGTNRSTLVGTTTWGKGVSFHYINLVGGGQLQLCTGIFVGPDGFDHRNKGVSPHQVVERTSGSAVDAQLAAGLKALDVKRVPEPRVVVPPPPVPDYTLPIVLVGLGVLTVIVVATVAHRRSSRRRRPRSIDRSLDQQFAVWVKQVEPGDAITEDEVVAILQAELVEPDEPADCSALTLSHDHFMVGAPCDRCDHLLQAGETVVEVLSGTRTVLCCTACCKVPAPAMVTDDDEVELKV